MDNALSPIIAEGLRRAGHDGHLGVLCASAVKRSCDGPLVPNLEAWQEIRASLDPRPPVLAVAGRGSVPLSGNAGDSNE
jgi:hypothetical protein